MKRIIRDRLLTDGEAAENDKIREQAEKDFPPAEMIQHQAEAWCHIVAELVCDFWLDTTEPGKNALEQVQKFLRRQKSSLEFYKTRCDALQRVQARMRDPERKMVCDILANGTTNVGGVI